MQIFLGQYYLNRRDFTMIGVCSFYPFGVVIWQDVSNMSLQSRFRPLCVAKICKNLQLSHLLVLYRCDFRQNLLKLRAEQ